MILQPDAVRERLQLLEEVTAELQRQPAATGDELARDVPRRWIMERGLIAAANLIFDITDHILAGHFHAHPETYESALSELRHRGVLSDTLYGELEGLGGLRNLLVHLYVRIEPAQIAHHHRTGPPIFRRFAAEMLRWLDGVERQR